MSALLALTNMSKVFSGVAALENVSMTIERGEICCLVGENGSGKSTLIKIIGGVYEATSGSLEIDGVTVKSYQPIDAVRAGIHIIHQDFALFDNLSVHENIAFPSEVIDRGLAVFSSSRSRSIARAALDRMGVSIDLNAAAGELSMVDRQLVAIASALVKDARLIIMDEPTTALSHREVKTLLSIIRGLKDNGVSTLFVSHKLDEILEISDHTVVLRNGHLVADRPSGELDRASLVLAMTGREVTFGEHVAETLGEDAEVLLELDELTRNGSYHSVSFTVRRGEVLGITGLLGSGRDTLALSLFGLLDPDHGRVLVGGKEVRLNSPGSAMAQGIGYLPEDRLVEGLFLEDSVQDNIVVRTVQALSNRLGLVRPRTLRTAAADWVGRLRIKTGTVKQPVNTLSGGNQQRTVLARWLSGKPRLLVLNGPTVGVDIGSKAEILDLIRDLAASGIGLVVISDDIPELLDVCHRVLVMRNGVVFQDLNRSEITEAKLNEMLVAA